MSPTWDSTADFDAAQSETGVHHEQPTGTDWAASDVVEKGYPTTDENGSALEAYFPLDEDSGTTLVEVTGNTGDGSISGTTINVPGILGTTAHSYDGTDDKDVFSTPPNCSGFDMSADFTVVLWLNAASTSDTQKIVHFYGNNDTSITISSGSISAGFWTGSNSETAEWTNPSADTWYAVGFGNDSSANTIGLYIDGTQQDTHDYGSATPATDNAFQNVLGQHGGDSNIQQFEGEISDCRIYSRILSASEHSDLYQAAI